MMKILIAVDGSEHANRAIEAVAKMAHSALDLQATMVCVSPEPLFYGDYTVGTIEKIEEDQKRQQNNILVQAMALGRTHGLQLGDPARAYGVIANEIVRIAKEREVDWVHAAWGRWATCSWARWRSGCCINHLCPCCW